MHVMVDIETLATSADAVIIQVGACYFDLNGDVGNFVNKDLEFLLDVKVTDQVKHLKRVVNPETIGWWMDETRPDARMSVLTRKSSDTLYTAILSLNEFICRAKNYSRDYGVSFGVWANSPTFDLSIIRHAMGQLDIKPSWSYGNEYDVRTLRFLNKHLELDIEYDKANGGVDHNALDDSKGQSKFVKSVLGVLNTGLASPTKSL